VTPVADLVLTQDSDTHAVAFAPIADFLPASAIQRYRFSVTVPAHTDSQSIDIEPPEELTSVAILGVLVELAPGEPEAAKTQQSNVWVSLIPSGPQYRLSGGSIRPGSAIGNAGSQIWLTINSDYSSPVSLIVHVLAVRLDADEIDLGSLT
jgi:hypothetical protein